MLPAARGRLQDLNIGATGSLPAGPGIHPHETAGGPGPERTLGIKKKAIGGTIFHLHALSGAEAAHRIPLEKQDAAVGGDPDPPLAVVSHAVDEV